MAWGDLASNQMVSYTDAQSGGFALKSGQSSVTSNQCMTKNDAFTKYNLAVTANTNSVASNQLMRKDYWVGATILSYSYTLYYSVQADVSLFGFTESSAACASTSPSITVYSSSSTIVAGMALFYDQYGNNPVYASGYAATDPYFKLNTLLVRFQQNDPETGQGNTVYDVSTCVAPSVTFSSTYYWSYITSNNGSGGTVTITGAPATFFARGVVINSGSAVSTSITINGNSRSVTRFSTPGTNDSTSFTLSPGTYSYSVTITLPQAGAVGGGIVWTQ